MVSEITSNFDTVFHEVQGGDTLSAIIKQYYRATSPQQRKDIISQILLKNSKIKNPNLIYPGQIIVMDVPRQYTATPGFPRPPTIQANEEVIETLKQNLESATPPERN